jgi:ribosomal protein S18 acetylase RimI-like enzyme
MANIVEKNLLIRKAKMKDFSRINSLSDELIGSPMGNRKRIFQKAMKDKNYLCLVAELNKKIIGFIDMWAFPDVSHGAYLAQIQNLIVSKKFRNKGIGAKLIKEAIKFSKKRKYHELHVWTEKKNKVAVKLYKKLGLKKEHVLLEKEL